MNRWPNVGAGGGKVCVEHERCQSRYGECESSAEPPWGSETWQAVSLFLLSISFLCINTNEIIFSGL